MIADRKKIAAALVEQSKTLPANASDDELFAAVAAELHVPVDLVVAVVEDAKEQAC